jgi:hypothetical protein
LSRTCNKYQKKKSTKKQTITTTSRKPRTNSIFQNKKKTKKAAKLSFGFTKNQVQALQVWQKISTTVQHNNNLKNKSTTKGKSLLGW